MRLNERLDAARGIRPARSTNDGPGALDESIEAVEGQEVPTPLEQEADGDTFFAVAPEPAVDPLASFKE